MRGAWLALPLLLTGCGQSPHPGPSIEFLPDLPEPVSNNAVAVLAGPDGSHLYSFMGIGAGKTHRDVHSRAWVLRPGATGWTRLPDVPGGGGRLAGVAAVAGGSIWVFGGYRVAPDGQETSSPGVYRWRPGGDAWQRVGTMPVPVDDTVAVVYQDRHVYLVSGWHDLGNVNLVQVFDTGTRTWSQATPYPGTPVFGHAGGMSGTHMVVCDGVRIEYPWAGGARRFLPADECWLGVVDATDRRRIGWRQLQPHPGPARYRMAAGADDAGRVVFAGGTTNPYNYDGTGYDGLSSEPEAGLFSLDLATLEWSSHGALPAPGMDHRGLPFDGAWFYLPGGMLRGRQVTARALRFKLD